MHKVLLVLASLAFATTASAQQFNMPTTIKLYNNNNGEVIGTATTSNYRDFYLRDLKGELIGTLTVNPDGTRKFLDPHGKEVDTLSIGGNLRPMPQ